MKGSSESKIYEQELVYWPYEKSWRKVLEMIASQAATDSELLDIMCGPGYLLGKIAEERRDLNLSGIDSDRRYIEYSKEKYPKINFEVVDVLSWGSAKLYDIVICTGSIHHIPYGKQGEVIKKIASAVKPGGFGIISDCHIDDYANEKERKIAAASLGYEYLAETIRKGATNKVIEATIDILYNDVMMDEFKTSLKKRMPILEKYFDTIEVIKTWPDIESEHGDYIMICKKNNK